jgi:uncharacterized protein YggU (UPF0235/DUF167 family)
VTTRLRVRVVPGAKESAIVGRYGDAWKLRVMAPPERGAANAAMLELLAQALRLPPCALTLVSGKGSRDKIVEVSALRPDEVQERLASAYRKDA